MPYKIKRILEVQEVTNGDTDQVGLCWTQNAGNCSGVTNWIGYDEALKRLFIRVNTGIDDVSIADKLQYAAKEEAGYLFRIMDGIWRWPSIVVCSKSALEGEYNQVNVLETSRGFVRLETIPPLANYDHLSVATHPHLFMRTWCTNKVGKTYDTKVGIVWQPLISPIGRPHANGNVSGMWLRTAYLGDAIGPVIPPPPVRTITIPAGAKYYSAAGKIKKTDVYRFAWTAPILEATTIKLISWYRVAASEWVRGDFN